MKKVLVIILAATLANFAHAALVLSVSGPGVTDLGGGDYLIDEGTIATVDVMSSDTGSFSGYLSVTNCTTVAAFVNLPPGVYNGTVIDYSSNCDIDFSNDAPGGSGPQVSADVQANGTDGQTFAVELSDGWDSPIDQLNFTIVGPCFPACHPDYDEWVSVGMPDSWCYPAQCKGNAVGDLVGSIKSGYYYVGTTDLGLLMSAWMVKESPYGPGIATCSGGEIPCIGADFDHREAGSPYAGYYRVGITDLCILQKYWEVKEEPDGPGIGLDCLDCGGCQDCMEGPVLSLQVDTGGGFYDPGDSVYLGIDQEIMIGIANSTSDAVDLYGAYVEMAGNLASGDWTGTTWHDPDAYDSLWTYFGTSVLPDKDTWQVEILDFSAPAGDLATVSSYMQYKQVGGGDVTIILYNEFYEEVDSLTLTGEYVEVVSPNGDESIVAGSTYPIDFDYWGYYLTTIIRLEYSTDNGSSWSLITDDAYERPWNWQVPMVESDQCLIRASFSSQTLNIEDVSDSTFTIYEAIKIPGKGSYSAIQAAINDANDFDTVIVADGIYTGDGNRDIDFLGKNITVRSENGPTNCIVDCQGSIGDEHFGFVVNCEPPGCRLEGFTIIGGAVTDFSVGAGVTLNGSGEGEVKNCIFTQNYSVNSGAAVHAFVPSGGLHPKVTNCTMFDNASDNHGSAVSIVTDFERVDLLNCISWGNTTPDLGVWGTSKSSVPIVAADFSILQGGWYDSSGYVQNCQAVDPNFADAANGDFHLMSEYGRWDEVSQSWVTDAVTSGAIDAGDPASDHAEELWPHGNRINMGAYGNTAEGSMSSSSVGSKFDLDHDGSVGISDVADFTEDWVADDLPVDGDIDRDGDVDLDDFALFAENFML